MVRGGENTLEIKNINDFIYKINSQKTVLYEIRSKEKLGVKIF